MPETTTVNEAVINQLAQDIHATALEKGFWEPPNPFLAEINTKLMLIASEVAEAQDVLRSPHQDSPINPYTAMSDYQGEEFLEELCDIIIRTLDLAQYFNWNIGETLLAKMAKNADRPRMHNKRF